MTSPTQRYSAEEMRVTSKTMHHLKVHIRRDYPDGGASLRGYLDEAEAMLLHAAEDAARLEQMREYLKAEILTAIACDPRPGAY